MLSTTSLATTGQKKRGSSTLTAQDSRRLGTAQPESAVRVPVSPPSLKSQVGSASSSRTSTPATEQAMSGRDETKQPSSPASNTKPPSGKKPTGQQSSGPKPEQKEPRSEPKEQTSAKKSTETASKKNSYGPLDLSTAMDMVDKSSLPRGARDALAKFVKELAERGVQGSLTPRSPQLGSTPPQGGASASELTGASTPQGQPKPSA